MSVFFFCFVFNSFLYETWLNISSKVEIYRLIVQIFGSTENLKWFNSDTEQTSRCLISIWSMKWWMGGEEEATGILHNEFLPKMYYFGSCMWESISECFPPHKINCHQKQTSGWIHSSNVWQGRHYKEFLIVCFDS